VAEALEPAVPGDIDELALEVLQAACEGDLKLVTAESCTGGLLASLLTDLPGMSHAFDRGFVTYTNESKQELLGVPPQLLKSPGAVSEPVARAMAEGALARAQGQVALAITGYAEPPKDEPAQAGVVHFGLAAEGLATRHRRECFGDVGRAEVRIRSLRTALEMLREALAERSAR
jgi:nicotinamide-nucleotide amidase